MGLTGVCGVHHVSVREASNKDGQEKGHETRDAAVVGDARRISLCVRHGTGFGIIRLISRAYG